MKNIVLFDMDGTLTPSRKQINNDMIMTLKGLLDETHVGIVTGSDFEYVKEQCHDLLFNKKINRKNLSILPCNGTKRYILGLTGWSCVYTANMRTKVGNAKFKQIISEILKLQSQTIKKYPDLSISGTFIQYRGSLLNWCPMGRNYTDEDRTQFIKLDNDKKIRKKLVNRLEKTINIKNDNITFVMGGECSIDIYPKGWDKTYSLKHFIHYENIYFVGDRCKQGGNDFHLYNKLSEKHTAFETKNPKDTIKIINETILPRIKKDV